MIEIPIIKSLLDNDLYTLTVGQLAYFNFPNVQVFYEFINRGRTDFPTGFDTELKNQINFLSQLKLADDEQEWLYKLPFIRPEYIHWLSNYQFDPSEVTIKQNGGTLKIHIQGTWARTIMYEVPLLALVSELYFKLTNQQMDGEWIYRIERKALNLSGSQCKWADFGTRRRFSYEVQREVVEQMRKSNGFLGTSNCSLAYKYGIKPIGTMSHQFPMVLSAIVGVKNANRECLQQWSDFYGNDLLIFLPDTWGTDVFLKDFGYDVANKWSGLRQDSGNPYDWMDNKIIPHYQKIGVPLNNKTMIFSDNLTDETFKQISLKYRSITNVVGGIGTFFTHDVGPTVKPLNIVIKAVECNGINITKFSDSPGKHTGKPEAIEQAKRELNVA